MSKHRSHSKSFAGGAPEALPALSSLLHVPSYYDLLPTPEQRAAFEEFVAAATASDSAVATPVSTEAGSTPELQAADKSFHLGCVVRLDRAFPAVVYDGGLVRAEFAASLSKAEDASRSLSAPTAPSDAQTASMRALGSKAARGKQARLQQGLQQVKGRKKSEAARASGKCAVGDWVVLSLPDTHEMGVIEAILPRRSEFSRWRGGARGERQVLAANVDVVLIAQAISDFGVSLNRIARSVVIARDCGAQPVVVLTKCDTASAGELERIGVQLAEVLGPEVAVVQTSSKDQLGLDAVAAAVGTGKVGIVLGESGAGKSTLLNALLGSDALETGAVRASDGAGRHTTVARRMVKLNHGGILVDEPGLRSLPLVGHEAGLARSFPIIASRSELCKFRDCTHTSEPGCAVQGAVSEGVVSPLQLEVWQALAREMQESAQRLDPDVRW